MDLLADVIEFLIEGAVDLVSLAKESGPRDNKLTRECGDPSGPLRKEEPLKPIKVNSKPSLNNSTVSISKNGVKPINQTQYIKLTDNVVVKSPTKMEDLIKKNSSDGIVISSKGVKNNSTSVAKPTIKMNSISLNSKSNDSIVISSKGVSTKSNNESLNDNNVKVEPLKKEIPTKVIVEKKPIKEKVIVSKVEEIKEAKEDIQVNPNLDPNQYDEKGFNYLGYHKNGTKRDNDGYDKDGYSIFGFDRLGFDKDGYDRLGYNKEGFDRDGFDKSGYNKEGYDRFGGKRFI